jgi:hypothetical protein
VTPRDAYRLVMRCDRNTLLASQGHDRELKFHERALVVIHTAICPPCREHERKLRLIREALAAVDSDAPAVPEAISESVVRGVLSRLESPPPKPSDPEPPSSR